MKIDASAYRVGHRKQVRLRAWATRVKPLYRSKGEYRKLLAAHVKELSRCQSLLYADGRHALFIIFQAMDAAGKDGAIKHVMSGVNPQGCQVHSFKAPSAEEHRHDFLWRTVCRLPERGQIGIFNRSYYEEVLVVRVHPELLQAEDLPASAAGKRLWRHRFQSINDLERHLHRNGTRVVKFFLHLSKGEQRRRLLDRVEEPAKNWKMSASDFSEHQRWQEFEDAYQACLSATSSRWAPWYVIPADDKETARLLVSQAILDEFAALPMKYPRADTARRKELRALKKSLRG